MPTKATCPFASITIDGITHHIKNNIAFVKPPGPAKRIPVKWTIGTSQAQFEEKVRAAIAAKLAGAAALESSTPTREPRPK